MTNKSLASWGLVRDLVLKGVSLSSTNNYIFSCLAFCISKLDGCADCNGDVALAATLDNLCDRENLSNLVDAGLVVRLLFFCSVILGVLRKVSKTTGLFDALNNLVVFLALTISQLIDKLLTAFWGKYNLFSSVHRVLSVDGSVGLYV